MAAESEIQKFYENKTIFLTGGTGFLGKMTVEKLLRTCNVKKIFLLMRPKKEINSAERFEKFFDSPIFANFQTLDFKEKVVFLNGDLQQPNLGLSLEDVRMIMVQVEVIFHWGATVNFTEDIKTATDINVKSVRDLLVLAKTMPQLKSFLYVSTAYSHCLQSEIMEEFYDDTMQSKDLITCVDSINEKTANDITPGFLDEWPNSYVFTKAVAENVIKNDGLNLPVGILRPSIVTASNEEPLPGWVQNLYGYLGLALAAALGYARVLCCKSDIKLNLVAADYVVNCGIAAAWQISVNKPQIPIYNCVALPHQTKTIREMVEITYKYATRFPSTHVMWHYMLIFVPNRTYFMILDYLLHYLPARFIDFLCVCTKRKPRFVKLYNKIHKFIDALIFFATRDWSFSTDNTISLWNSLSDKDKEFFNFYFDSDWEEYGEKCALGVRIYLLKDPLETLPAGRRNVRILKYAHYTLVTFLISILCCILYCLLKCFI